MSIAGWSERTTRAGRAAIDGQTRGLRAMLPFVGPAVVASIAYMDPGNFATNIEAGAKYGYMLLWVVVFANATAMLFQAQSARIGLVTGKSLATLCFEQYSRPVVYAMWIASEIGAMATDLAEFLGAAIGFSLLTGEPLLSGLLFAAAATYAMLMTQAWGFRPMEALIATFVGLIGLGYIVELWLAPPDWSAVAVGALTPRLTDARSLGLAVAIVGATIMPHAIYLHSSLTRSRVPLANVAETRRALNFSNIEVLVALGLAGLINMAMVCMAAAVFHPGNADIAEIETAYRTLSPLLGHVAGAAFMVALLASGLSSSVVGTMAGQEIMRDFAPFTIPLWLRRLATMIPSFAVVAAGFDATESLVLSQVVLSLVLPVPMIALLRLAARRDLMGTLALAGFQRGLCWAAATVILALNLVLLASAAGVPIPGMAG